MAPHFFGHHDSPSNLGPGTLEGFEGGRLDKRTKQNPARAGWPRRLALVRVTSRAENCHYQCSIVFMRQGNLSIIGTFLINSLHFPDIRG